MIIKGPDFYLESSVSDERNSFDLYIMQRVNSKTNPRDELKLSGYGLPIERCIENIARNRAARKHKNEDFEDIPMTIQQYHDDFLNALEEVKQMIHGTSVPTGK